MRNYGPYEKVLRNLEKRGDIWMVSQGEYMSWWLARKKATLRISVSDGRCQVDTSLERAVIEQYPGQFLDTALVTCKETTFSGEVRITIDSTLDEQERELLIELLTREGILNLRIAEDGEFMLSRAEIKPLLENIERKLCERDRLFEEDIDAVRQCVIDKLAARNLPLLRVWYHPRLNGVVTQAVFSPRFDVDRAITNLARIRKLENKHGASSTLYLRAFCPFYTDSAVKGLASVPWCSEIALHGEFVTNAPQYGDEIKAAAAEKRHLEELVGRPILGVCMHGGELSANTDQRTAATVQAVGLLYDTTQRIKYYFPFRKIIDGRLSESYCLAHALGDIKIPASHEYEHEFYGQTIAQMNEIYEQRGVFVFMLHPVYFGFFRYVFHPTNWGPFIRFFWRYFTPSRHQAEGRS
jgi:hypothetical protein